MKTFLFTLCIFLAVSNVFGQSKETLTNQSIIDLTKAGINAKTIVSKINSSACNFVTTTDALITLKKSGVQEDVIDAMVNKGTSAATATAPAATTTDNNESSSESGSTSADAPAASSSVIANLKQQGSGIYYADGSSITELEPTVFSQEKNGSNYWAAYWSYGFARSKKIMSVGSSHANAQFSIKRPVFYFYFDPENKSLNAQSSSWYANASSPNEFLMVKFNTKVKNSRAVTTASHNSYEYASGIDDEFKREFKFKKIEKGIYEIYFEGDLDSGEYGFMYAGAAATNSSASPKVYDFGIK